MNLLRALRLSPKSVVALSGGGGKTTLMFRMADELAVAGQHVITTMTTRIFVSQMAQAPACMVLHGEQALLAQLSEALSEHGHVLVAGGTALEQDKVAGVPRELVDHLIAHPATDAVVVEADGSRRRPFKAPAAHEPVIPASTTVVVPVVGLDILGKRLTAEHVHRPEIVAALTGAVQGDPVTLELIAAILAHPQGGAKGLPPGARVDPLSQQGRKRDSTSRSATNRASLAGPPDRRQRGHRRSAGG